MVQCGDYSWRLYRNLEHKVEHNNCRMRGTDPDLEPSPPTVSALLRVRAARMIHLSHRHTPQVIER